MKKKEIEKKYSAEWAGRQLIDVEKYGIRRVGFFWDWKGSVKRKQWQANKR